MQAPDINLYKLGQCYEAFVEFVEEKGKSEFKSFSHPYLDWHENYKSRVRQESLTILDVFSWKKSDIGSGTIIDKAIRAIEQPPKNNLVQTRRWRFHEEQRYHRSLYQAQQDPKLRQRYETLLFEFFHHRMDDGQAMGEFIDLAGRKYSFVAFFYFLKDDRRYVPIAPANFDRAFTNLGIDFKTSGRCSWENYQTYNHIIRRVRDFLRDQLTPEVTLLDAHSFLWILVNQMKKVQIQAREPAAPLPIPSTTIAVSPPPRKDQPTGPVDFDAWQRKRSEIGRRGEEFVIQMERQTLTQAGKPDLAELVGRVDHTRGFDIISFDVDGTEKQIEIKTVQDRDDFVTFHLTQNQLEKSQQLPNYYLYLVKGIPKPDTRPYAVRRPDFQNSDKFHLQVENYQVTVRIVPDQESTPP